VPNTSSANSDNAHDNCDVMFTITVKKENSACFTLQVSEMATSTISTENES